jgi:hypothetical protein
MSVPDVAATPLSPVAWRAPFAPTAAVLALTAVFFSAVALPLATYTTALALFGLAHVGSELRYVDYRHLQERKEIPGRATAAPASGSAGAR